VSAQNVTTSSGVIPDSDENAISANDSGGESSVPRSAFSIRFRMQGGNRSGATTSTGPA